MVRAYALVTLLITLLALPATGRAEVRLAAPAAMSGLIDDVIATWTASGGAPITVIYGHSGEQARAIQMGDSPDIFISADPDAVTPLLAKGLIEKASLDRLAATRLIIAARIDDHEATGVTLDSGLAHWLETQPLAMCDPISVASGHFARQALATVGAWDAIKTHLLLVGHPRAVLSAVDHGEARLGVAFRSDLASMPKLREVATFPLTAVPPIIFPVALLAGHSRPETLAFYGFLRSAAVVQRLPHHGFDPPPIN